MFLAYFYHLFIVKLTDFLFIEFNPSGHLFQTFSALLIINFGIKNKIA